MHTSTGRFPFSQRSPSKRRAFLGVFNITKSFGRHDKCQRPRMSLQIKRCQPITPPIIRRKHREIPIFARGRHAGAFDCRILAKMHVATTPTWREPKQKRGLPFRRTPQNERTPAARSAQRGLLACPRTRQEGAYSLPGQERLITRRCKPSCACPRQHRTGCQSGSRGASSSQDRSRCSQPGRSRSRRRRKPCCRSRQPER